MLSKEEVLHLLNEAKKEVDRLETNRQEDLGNSINYIENELQLQRVLSQVEAYEKSTWLIDYALNERGATRFR